MADDRSSEVAQSGQKAEFTELDWLTLKNDINSVQMKTHETSREKFKRKFYDNPFVPIGCGLTTAALCFGLWNFSTGKRKSSQNMMRLRVFAQGFTIVALMLGIVKTSLK